jgi:hypothetical protein
MGFHLADHTQCGQTCPAGQGWNPKSKSVRKDAETPSYRKAFFFCFSLRNLSGFA